MSNLSLLEKVSFKRSLDSYAKVRSFYTNIIRNKLIQKQLTNFENMQYLNVGCGSNINSKFIT